MADHADEEGYPTTARGTAGLYAQASQRVASTDASAAEDLFAQAIQCDPTSANTHLLLATYLADVRHDYPRALTSLLRALELDPDHVQAQDRLALYQRRSHTVSPVSDGFAADKAEREDPAFDHGASGTIATVSDDAQTHGVSSDGDQAHSSGGKNKKGKDADAVHIRTLPALRELLVPPINFSMVCGLCSTLDDLMLQVTSGVYRSGYPNARNFAFLRKLGIRTIVNLCREPYLPPNQAFVQETGIAFVQVKLYENIEPFLRASNALIGQAVTILSDPKMHPVLVHCTKGGNKTGVVVGCLRKLQCWSLTSILAEFRRFTEGDSPMDEQVIEQFDASVYARLSPR